jgi:nucleoside-diphosphate-sugar epimerase
MPTNVLIAGGTGFIGRHLVSYLVENNLADHIRVVDKVIQP